MMNEKPMPMGSGDRTTGIPPAASSIAARGVQALEMSVPEFHRTFLRSLGISAGNDSTIAMPSGQRMAVDRTLPQKKESFVRGDVAMDTEKGVRVTVIKCAVAQTKGGTPIHRVVSKRTGDSWKVSEKKLKRLDE